jgi:hypothetical protein
MEKLFFYVLPIIILSLGLFGNFAGFILITFVKTDKIIYPKLILKLLFTVDSAQLLLILDIIFRNYGYNLMITSNLICKYSMYFNGSIFAISPFLLVYIKIDKSIRSL